MSTEQQALRQYVERLAADPLFIAEMDELDRKIAAGESLGEPISMDELRAKFGGVEDVTQ